MKTFTHICIFVFFNQLLYSQALERFHLSFPEKLISNSKYNSIDYLDSRLDTVNFGIVYSKHYKRKVPLIPSVNLNTQLNWLIQGAIDSSSLKGELLFQLRKLEFVELGGDIPDYGYCPLRADLYVKKSSGYFLLARIDTFIATARGIGHIDVTEELMNATKQTLSNFVLRNLHLESSTKKWNTLDHILHADSIEKTHIPLYTTQKYNNGVYLSYASFKIQKPDYTLLKVSSKDNEIQSLTLLDKKGKSLKITYKEVYAFVYKDTAYISDHFGSYVLQKINNDFYFKGKGRVLPKDETLNAVLTADGQTTEQIKLNNNFAFYNAKIDHYDGSVIWYDKVK